MTDIPIIFSAPMVRALIEGRKTMTRRLAWRDSEFGLQQLDDDMRADFARRGWKTQQDQAAPKLFRTFKPTSWQKAKPGDRLWVRENIYQFGGPIEYAANEGTPSFKRKMTPSIHMPRWASRLTLTLTAVKIEPLQAITADDAKAEGCGLYVAGHGWITEAELRGDPGYSNFLAPRLGFEDVWCTLHGDQAWAANPDVVALTFTVEKANVDARAAA